MMAGGCAGTKRRTRAVVVPATGTGKCPEEKREEARGCVVGSSDCDLGEWDEWSSCQKTASQADGRFYYNSMRTRAVEVPATGIAGKCPGRLEEKRHCMPAGEVSANCILAEWDDWSSCRKQCYSLTSDCDEFRSRSRAVDVLATGTGKCPGPSHPEREETELDCSSKDCVLGEWDDWSSCQKTASQVDGRFHYSSTRTRVVDVPAKGPKGKCPEKLQEKRRCMPEGEVTANCVLGEWDDWSSCRKQCYLDGTDCDEFRSRSRAVDVLATGTGKCPGPSHPEREETELDCSSKDCVLGEWDDWSSCQKTASQVDGRFHYSLTRTRVVDVPAKGPKGKCPEKLQEKRRCMPRGH